MKKVVIAIDSFKGCLTSAEANEAARQGVLSACPSCEVITIPVADGGEGWLDILVALTNGNYIPVKAHDPLMKPRKTAYGVSGDGKTVFIEMATINGLPLVPPEHRNPWITTSFGTGELIKDALQKGYRDFIIGLGGSATSDAGLGMLQALGFDILDAEGKEIEKGGRAMQKVASISGENIVAGLREARFKIACDVTNPFYGAQGAAYVFAPQKGAGPAMVEQLDHGMRSLAKVFQQTTGRDITSAEGAGAAGGIAGAFMAFLNTEVKPGAEILLDMAAYNEKLEGADIVITGEGKADPQTCMGKVPFRILQRAKKRGIPVILIAGKVEQPALLKEAGFQNIYSIHPPQFPQEKAMDPDISRKHIRQVTEQICKH